MTVLLGRTLFFSLAFTQAAIVSAKATRRTRSDVRKLQDSEYCRCMAPWEDLYRRGTQGVDYDSVYRDSDGYYVIDDVRVLNCRSSGNNNVDDIVDGFRGIFNNRLLQEGADDEEDPYMKKYLLNTFDMRRVSYSGFSRGILFLFSS